MLARSCSWVKRHRVGRDGERQDRLVGRIDLGVGRRRRQAGRQQAVGRVDRLLHVLLGDVEVHRQVELQGDDRGASTSSTRSSAAARESGRAAPRAAPSPWSTSPAGWRRDRRSGPGSSGSRRRAATRRGRKPTETRPTSTSAIISSDVATGRTMNRRETFIAPSALCGLVGGGVRPSGSRRCGRRRLETCGAVARLGGAARP